MSPGDPSAPTEIAEPAIVAGADSESTLVAVSHDGKKDSDAPYGVDHRIPVVGTKIGKYELIEELGTGGMSVVFKARDLALDRYVALKILLPQSGAKQIDTMRFQQEARAASRLEHTNIVKVHDFNITEDGIPYLVMSYLEGVSLSSEIKKEGGLQVGRWLSIMVQACDALTHAHENNVVHRDIKPSNFVLCQEKGTEVLKLVDFGIAKIETNDDQALTKTGEVFGSPMYMSPEQCSGSKVDSRSDVYSLGCVMYEALAGKPPLAGENSLATIVKHLQEKPESLTNVCRNVKNIESIDNIVMKCLEKKPEDRYPDTLSVRKELEQIFLGLQVKGKPVDRRLLIAAVSLILILCAAAVWYQSFSAAEKVKSEQAAGIRKKKQSEELRALEWQARDYFQKGKPKLAIVELDKAIKLATDAQATPVDLARITIALGDCETVAKNQASAQQDYLKVTKMALPMTDPNAILNKYLAYQHLGYDAKYNNTNSKDAKPYYLKALEFAEGLKFPKPKRLMLMELSSIAEEEGHIEEAAGYLQRAQAIQYDNTDIAKAMVEFYARQKHYKKAKNILKDIDRIEADKKQKKEEKEKRKAREKAIEEESDRRKDEENATTGKKWGQTLMETEKK